MLVVGGRLWFPYSPARTGCQVLAEPAGRLSCVEGNRPSGLVKGLVFLQSGGQQADFFRFGFPALEPRLPGDPGRRKLVKKRVAYTSSSLSFRGFLEQSVWQLERKGRAAGDHLWEGAFGGGMGTRDLQETEGGAAAARAWAQCFSRLPHLQFGSSPGRVRVAGTCEGRMLRVRSRSIWGNLSLRKPPVFPGEAKLRVLAPWLSALVQDCSPGQCLPEPSRAHQCEVPAARSLRPEHWDVRAECLRPSPKGCWGILRGPGNSGRGAWWPQIFQLQGGSPTPCADLPELGVGLGCAGLRLPGERLG